MRYDYNGQKLTMIELAKQAVVPYKTLYARLTRFGWDLSIAVTTPLTTPRSYKKIKRKHDNTSSVTNQSV